MEGVVREVNLMKQLKHPYIVEFVDFQYLRHGTRSTEVFILMEYCYGELNSLAVVADASLFDQFVDL